MTTDEVKELKELFKDEIGSIKDEIGSIKDDMRLVKGQLSTVNDKLDTHTTSLVVIEDTLKGYGDMYKVNKDKSNELDERVTVIEDHLGLTPAK